MKKLGTDFGNSEADSRLILIDSDFSRYRDNKMACFQEDRGKYFLTHQLPPRVARAAIGAIAGRLASDYPDLFELSLRCLSSRITGESIAWTDEGLLDPSRTAIEAPIVDPLEGLSLQIQADLAIVIRRSDGSDYVAALDVCAPSDWAPSEKIGKSFFDTHQPVPGFERVNAAAPHLVESIIRQGPFVRFVWGVETDDRLNHHPSPPPGVDPVEWKGRQFDKGRFWVRTERQTLLGLPEVDAALFFIHVQTTPDTMVLASPDLRDALRRGLMSMSPEARYYKGVAENFIGLVGLLG